MLRSHSATAARVHHAGCWTISGEHSHGAALTEKYVKVCAEQLAELDQWAINEVGEPVVRCGTCHPASAAVQPSSIKQTEAVAAAVPDVRHHIHGPAADSPVVEAWADDYIRFDNLPVWQKHLRDEIRSRCRELTPSAAQVLHATFFGMFADRPRLVTAHQQESPVSSSAAPQATSPGLPTLNAYPVFSEALLPISQTSADRVIDNVVRIVGIEGPVTGWRIHEVYKKCATSRESHDELSRLLNRAISAAERHQRIVSENPFNQTGNKPRTFRLPSQSSAVARELGPRTIDIVPPGEVLQYCRNVSAGQTLSEDDLVDRVSKLLRAKQAPTELRKAVVAAQRLDAKARSNRVARPARASAYGSNGPGSQRSESVCPSCFTVHAGECA
jgi:hypothetical protein